MLRTTKNMKEKYEKIQNYLFSLIPEKWDEIHLYASVGVTTQEISNEEKGELFFYYLPKGILRKRAINVYEVPQRFNLNEEQYLKIVEELYNCIKSLQQDFFETEQEIWTNVTISIANFRFKVEYKYDVLPSTEEEIYERNVIWKYKYLKIGGENKKERTILDNYFLNPPSVKKETYEAGIYLKTDNNKITFDKEEIGSNQKEFIIYEKEDIANIITKTKKKFHSNINKNVEKDSNDEEEKHHSKNQILNN